MEAPLWLLLLWGCIGSFDSLYNHLYRYRLHAHPSSFTEHLSHTLLTLGLVLTATMLVLVEMGSAGFAFFLVVQAFVLLITLWDVSMEHTSRAPLGGFPTHEYVLHTVIFLLHGAFVWAVLVNTAQLVHGSGFGTFRWPPLPFFLSFQAAVFLVVALGVFFLHVYLLGVGYRTIKKAPNASAAELSRS